MECKKCDEGRIAVHSRILHAVQVVFNGAKSMNGLLTAGRFFFAIAMVFFGANF